MLMSPHITLRLLAFKETLNVWPVEDSKAIFIEVLTKGDGEQVREYNNIT